MAMIDVDCPADAAEAEEEVELAVRVAQLEVKYERLLDENARLRRQFELLGWAGTLLNMAATSVGSSPRNEAAAPT